MWIEAVATETDRRQRLICDECGALFVTEQGHVHSRDAVWHSANIAGWARIARVPDRHVCAAC
jgi:hypothetical protein